jgi:hypothetical protein
MANRPQLPLNAASTGDVTVLFNRFILIAGNLTGHFWHGLSAMHYGLFSQTAKILKYLAVSK